MDAEAMLEIEIMKIEDPSCFWGRIVKGAGVHVEDPKEYDNLQVKLNLFYQAVNLDVQKLKLKSLQEGQVCVVYSPTLKSWCRAVVKSLFPGTVGCQALCFLSDHAEHIIVSSDDIRAPVEKFLQLPFMARKFQLARIQPVTLQVSVCLEKATLEPTGCWDRSATRYLYHLVQASTLKEAIVCGQQEDSTVIELYLTIRNIKICVNDELVTKRFACFLNMKGESCFHICGGDVPLLTLDFDIFTCSVMHNGWSKRSVWPPFSPVNKMQDIYCGTGEVHRFSKDRQEPAMEHDDSVLGLQSSIHTMPSAVTEEYVESSVLLDDLTCNVKITESRRSEFDCEQNEAEGLPELKCCDQRVTSKHFTGIGTQNNTHISTGSDLGVQWPQNALTQQQSMEDTLACRRLLQFLNPDPLNPESSPLTPFQQDPSRSQVLIHSAFTINPCHSLASAPITDRVRKALVQKGYSRLGAAECYCWPAVFQGHDTLLVSHNGSDPLTYLPAFLSHLQLSSVFSGLTTSAGPRAVILCPGWEKAQQVASLLEEIPGSRSFKPMIVLLGCRKDEAKAVKIQANCELLVTTPFSLLRLLPFHCFHFLKLSHVVLDDVDVLYARAPEEMSAILQHIQKTSSSKERSTSLRQIIAVGRRWCRPMEGLVREHMSDPCVIITIAEEAALYGNVRQMVLLSVEYMKMSALLHALDFTPDVTQKTLVIANSVDEAEQVFKAVINTAAFCLKVHEGLAYQFDFVIQQWNTDIGPGCHIVLVTTSECVKALGIQDASCVVHYGFPTSPRLFGSRLYCMSKNFRNISHKDCVEKPPPKSVLLLSERNSQHVIGVLRYLERSDAILPPELMHFAQGVAQAKEKQKVDRPLCSYLKSFGFCRDERICPDRHSINPEQDSPRHPASGSILLLPLYIKDASCYYGRIVSGKEDCYESLAVQMAEHYGRERLNATELIEGGLYGIQEEDVYHRVLLLTASESGDHLFRNVKVRFLDEGREQEVKAHQLLELPSCFQSLPPQAVEIIVCRVQPIDGELKWNPKVTRSISQKIKGLQHHAKVVLCLGNTVWVDPMMRITRLPGIKTSINEYDVYSEILATGMAANNPEHMEMLRALLSQSGTMETAPCERPATLEDSLQRVIRAAATEDVFETAKTTAGESLHSQQEAPADTLEEMVMPDSADKNTETRTHSAAVSEILRKKAEVLPNSDTTIPTLHSTFGPISTRLDDQPVTLNVKKEILAETEANGMQDLAASVENGLNVKSHDSTVPITRTYFTSNTSVEDMNAVPTKRFHPQITWFQKDSSITLNIKLLNPAGQKCEFFPDRVVYSAAVNDRHYYADLALQGTIVPDRCLLNTKCNEPTVMLSKAEQGFWKKLLREKNAFISLDFEHFNEDEERTAEEGRRFTENSAEDWYYVNSDSSSDSDYN